MAQPRRLLRDPILESILEIRFEPSVPDDAVLGLVYPKVKSDFSKPEGLPILNLPADIRSNDPDLKYKAWYVFKRDNFHMRLGPRAIVFSNIAPYAGWDKWYDFFSGLIDEVRDTGLTENVSRVGLRYINFFESTTLLVDGNIELSVAGQNVSEQPTNIRTEFPDEDFVKVLQIANKASINNRATGKESRGSIIDIDCVYQPTNPVDDFYSGYREIVENAHAKEKLLFFSLIEGSVLESCGPEY